MAPVMDITWLGHSCFFLKGKQSTVLTDPFSPETGYSLGKTSAGIVTVSHRHPGHSYTQGVGGNPHIVDGPGEYEINNVLIIGLSTFHDKEKGSERGKNTVYLIELDEVNICHLGDLGQKLSDAQIEELGKINILMLPVGGGSSLKASEAAEVMRQLEPNIVIPMHYKTPAYKGELEPIDAFLKEISAHDLVPQAKLSINRANLPLVPQVVLLSC